MQARCWSDLSGRSLRAQRGASAVEFAIIAPLFFMLTFGAITSAVTFNDKNQITHAAREGGRYGATLSVDTSFTGCAGTQGFCWAQNVLDVTVQRGFGDLASGIPGRYVCVSLVIGSPGDVFSDTGTGPYGVEVTGTGVVTSRSTPCISDGGADGGQRVQVITKREDTINAVLFQIKPTLVSDAISKVEQQVNNP